MKKFFFALTITIGLAACREAEKGSNGVTYKSPVQYNDYIVGRQATLMKNIIAFGKMAQINPDSAGKMLDIYAGETTNFITEIKGMPPYKGDSSLRDAAINTFIFYKKVFEDDYRQILQINKEGENMTEQSAAKLKGIVEDLSKEEEKFDKAFHNAQVDFAQRNKMKLIDNEMQKKVDEMKKE